MANRVFDPSNASGASVYDVDRREKLGHVMSVDIDAGEVRCAHQPLRLVGDEVQVFTVRFRSIYPIWAGSPRPVLFHCYGRS